MKVYTNTENFIKDTLQTIPENCKIFPEFKPYPKWGQLHNATEQDLSNKKFVIFEKIHGTNTGCHIYFDEDGYVKSPYLTPQQLLQSGIPRDGRVNPRFWSDERRRYNGLRENNYYSYKKLEYMAKYANKRGVGGDCTPPKTS